MDIMFDETFSVAKKEMPVNLKHEHVIFVMEDIDVASPIVLSRGHGPCKCSRRKKAGSRAARRPKQASKQSVATVSAVTPVNIPPSPAAPSSGLTSSPNQEGEQHLLSDNVDVDDQMDLVGGVGDVGDMGDVDSGVGGEVVFGTSEKAGVEDRVDKQEEATSEASSPTRTATLSTPSPARSASTEGAFEDRRLVPSPKKKIEPAEPTEKSEASEGSDRRVPKSPPRMNEKAKASRGNGLTGDNPHGEHCGDEDEGEGVASDDEEEGAMGKAANAVTRALVKSLGGRMSSNPEVEKKYAGESDRLDLAVSARSRGMSDDSQEVLQVLISMPGI